MNILRDVVLLAVVKQEVSTKNITASVYRSRLKLYYLSVEYRVLRAFISFPLRIKTYVTVSTLFVFKVLTVN